MTRLVVSTDASVKEQGSVGIGYVVERVRDDGEQVEILVRNCEEVSLEDVHGYAEKVARAEYEAVVRGAKAAVEHEDNERLVVRTDSQDTVSKIQAGQADDFEAVTSGVEVEVRNIPRVLNSLADSLAKQASRGKVR